ncbi:MAG: flavin oxidoreductase, partial [Flavobacteriales bacterium]|nr:flavin oxidoreductase [Flavobacteriales bacterium]
PDTRQTYPNLKSTGFYTINHVTEAIHANAHQTSARYPAEVSEFDTCNLTEEYIDDFPAPFVKESMIKIGMSYLEEIYIKSNDTRLVIGKVEKLIIPEALLESTGHLDIDAANTVTIGGLDTYFGTKKLGRYQYAKP